MPNKYKKKSRKKHAHNENLSDDSDASVILYTSDNDSDVETGKCYQKRRSCCRCCFRATARVIRRPIYFLRLTAECILSIVILCLLFFHWYESHPDSFAHRLFSVIKNMTLTN